MPQQNDYILRMIEQLGAALRRARELLSRSTPAAAEALEEVRAAEALLLGDRRDMLRHLDAATAASLFPDRDQLALWIQLLRLEAESLRRLGDPARAAEREDRAGALQREADAREASRRPAP